MRSTAFCTIGRFGIQKGSKLDKDLMRHFLGLLYAKNRTSDEEIKVAVRVFSCSKDDYILQK